MDTLKQLIDFMIFLTQLALVFRFIMVSIEGADMTDPSVEKQQRRKRQNLFIALIAIACVYDIPKLVISYFGK